MKVIIIMGLIVTCVAVLQILITYSQIKAYQALRQLQQLLLRLEKQ